MLDNCRAYNGPDSPWGLYADSFQLAAARMLQLSRAGEEEEGLFLFLFAPPPPKKTFHSRR